MRLTTKQIQILECVISGNRDGTGVKVSWVDIDQLAERLPYSATKQALQCSIRFLRVKGLLDPAAPEVRRGRKRTVLIPTQLAIDIMDSAVNTSVESDDDGIVEYL